ncbi:hypothetical protein [Pseudomonas sp.]|uniref:hypothetical protein n=1 Tax=Pseudomonas sp. TaxID=306 RepID=UPI003D6E2B23
MDKMTLKADCEFWRSNFRHGQAWWSAAHHVALFGSIVASITAGALIQVRPDEYQIAASTLTAIAAALTGMAAAGGFERKWRSNRLSRSRIDGLLLDLEGESSDIAAITRQLKDVILRHDQEIVLQDPAK